MTKINLDTQSVSQNLVVGSSVNQANMTVKKGASAISTVGLTVENSQVIQGNLQVNGNISFIGTITEQSVTTMAVADLTIRVNKGGTTLGATGASGMMVEGDAGSTIGAIYYDPTKISKFSIGNGTSQAGIVDESSTQTLVNKTLNSPILVSPTIGGSAILAGAFRRIAVSGTQNGTNTAFTIPTALLSGSDTIIQNGIVLQGGGNDYTLTGLNIAFVTAPLASDTLIMLGVY